MPPTPNHDGTAPPQPPWLHIEPATTPEQWRQALGLLDDIEARTGVPPVDEAERRRLVAAIDADRLASDAPDGWRCVLATTTAGPVGYAGWRLPNGASSSTGTVTGDVAVAPTAVRDHLTPGALLALLLQVVRTQVVTEADLRTGPAPTPTDPAPARTDPAPAGSGQSRTRPVIDGVEVWLRHADDALLAAAASAGFRTVRRLGILGRDLPIAAATSADDSHDRSRAAGPEPSPDPTTGPSQDPTTDLTTAPARDRTTGSTTDPTPEINLRHFRPGADDEAVVAVLAAAYAGTADGGWNLDVFTERIAWDWFRPEDLLVAEVAGRILGVHWLKRRSATEGEVYNLAVHPDAQGLGLGPRLLTAGLKHLAAIGCTQVLLWVDLANERAVALYRRHGFVTRWQDVALAFP